jgi:hypothetical protein
MLNLQETLGVLRGLAVAAVQRVIFCECGEILDCRSVVVLHAGNREFTYCSACGDKLAARHGLHTSVDGRVVYWPRRPGPLRSVRLTGRLSGARMRRRYETWLERTLLWLQGDAVASETLDRVTAGRLANELLREVWHG